LKSGQWRLKFAPHKCTQTVFSRAKRHDTKELDIKLYGEKIPVDKEPKLLGMKFDRRLNFGAQASALKTKAAERLNILKILSYDRNRRLDYGTLIKIYKSLVLSILDYTAFMFGTISSSYMNTLEAVQNNALRILFRLQRDEISNDELRKKANVISVRERGAILYERNLQKTLMTENPIALMLIDDYLAFKRRQHIDPAVAQSEFERQIIEHNLHMDFIPEKIPTLLCRSTTIKERSSNFYHPFWRPP